MGWIIALIVGGVAGWLASMVMNRDASMGIFWNIVVGCIGSIVGNLVANQFGFAVFAEFQPGIGAGRTRMHGRDADADGVAALGSEQVPEIGLRGFGNIDHGGILAHGPLNFPGTGLAGRFPTTCQTSQPMDGLVAEQPRE